MTRFGRPGRGSLLLLLTLAGCAPGAPTRATATSPAPTAVVRAQEDRADDGEPFAIHPIYLLPSDAKDRSLDTDGTIARSIDAMDRWLKQQTGGKTLRFDRFHGKPDVTFLRLQHTDASLTTAGADALGDLHLAVAAAGYNDPRKIYLYYYEGGVGVPKDIAGVTEPGASCLFLGNAGDLPDDRQDMSGVDVALLHELMHAQDLVPGCAAHPTNDAGLTVFHTTDDPSDLMAAAHGKSDKGANIKLDPGHDDYYDTGVPGCPDLARSMYLDPTPDEVLPLQWRPLVASMPDTAFASSLPPTAHDAATNETLAYTSVQLAEGPNDTYTLMVQATGVLDYKGGSAGLSLDDQPPKWFVPLTGTGNLRVYASLPRHIKVRPTVWVSAGAISAPGHVVFPLNATVDGEKPLASAITVDAQK